MNENLFLEYENYNMGLIYYLDISQYYVTIYNDATCVIRLELPESFYSTSEMKKVMEHNTWKFKISKNKLLKLKKYVKDVDFLNIPSDVSSDGCDGYESYITVYTDNKSHRCGGYLPYNENYETLEHQIYKTVGNKIDFFINHIETQLRKVENKF